MLSVDDAGATALKTPLEIVQSVIQDNALLVDPAKKIWISGSFESSGFKPANLAQQHGRIVTGTSGAVFNRTETIPVASSPTGHWVRVIRTEMQQFQARTESEISRLSMAVESLARAVSAIRHNAVDEGEATVENDFSFDVAKAAQGSDQDLASALNCLADLDNAWNAQWAEIAQSKLNAPSPSLRAASARAIAAHDSAMAEGVLPQRLEAEANRFVRSVLRSALAAARA
jgi:hypothetical protein